jgi:predicted DNA-binding transcriptional regulator AlpA
MRRVDVLCASEVAERFGLDSSAFYALSQNIAFPKPVRSGNITYYALKDVAAFNTFRATISQLARRYPEDGDVQRLASELLC